MFAWLPSFNTFKDWHGRGQVIYDMQNFRHNLLSNFVKFVIPATLILPAFSQNITKMCKIESQKMCNPTCNSSRLWPEICACSVAPCFDADLVIGKLDLTQNKHSVFNLQKIQFWGAETYLKTIPFSEPVMHSTEKPLPFVVVIAFICFLLHCCFIRFKCYQ